jgi:hypothetical protein
MPSSERIWEGQSSAGGLAASWAMNPNPSSKTIAEL